MAKYHIHEEQFDNALHARCGRADDQAAIVSEELFAALDPATRCKWCERDQYPNGQPDWDQRFSILKLAEGSDSKIDAAQLSHVWRHLVLYESHGGKGAVNFERVAMNLARFFLAVERTKPQPTPQHRLDL